MKEKIKKIIPGYAIVPLTTAVAVNMIIYFGTSSLRGYLHFHSLGSPLDDRIPFCAPFVLFYVLAYVQWIANYLLIAREGKAFCYRFAYGDAISKIFCLG